MQQSEDISWDVAYLQTQTLYIIIVYGMIALRYGSASGGKCGNEYKQRNQTFYRGV